MKSYQMVLLVTVLVCSAAMVIDTSEFWRKALNTSELGYHTFSGHIDIDWYYPSGESGMYFTLWSAFGHSFPDPNPDVPLILWLQGGPGASSQFGAFTEIGPIRIVNGKVVQGTLPWNIVGHLVCIDQPLNVGFSFAGDRMGKDQVSSAHQAADHLLNFLYNLYKQWPSLKQSPLYITGESFAGHYIPAFASKIVDNYTFLLNTNITLGGVAIGDGWTDPISQVNYYDSYLYSAGIVSNKFRDIALWFQTHCVQNILQRQFRNATSFFDFLTNNDSTPINYWGGMSTFNFRHYGASDDSFAAYLQQHRLQLTNNGTLNFIAGNDMVYDSFANDITLSYAQEVVVVLQKTRVLIYNGQDDFVVNTPGVLTYLNSLNWAGIGQWKRAKKQIWTSGGQVKGWAKVSGNLWFVLVNKAGHMVPTDQPLSAFDMFGHFLFNDLNWKL